jgi:hypothetical protein
MALGPRGSPGLCSASRPKHHAGSGPLSSNVSQHTRQLRRSPSPLGRQSPPNANATTAKARGHSEQKALRCSRSTARASVHQYSSGALRHPISVSRTSVGSSQSVGPPFGGGRLCLRRRLMVKATGESTAQVQGWRRGNQGSSLKPARRRGLVPALSATQGAG